MVVIEDTRNKIGQHSNISEYFTEHGIGLVRSKLAAGDYCSPPAVAVDTKQGMEEVYTDLIQQHDRFRDECILAQSMGTQLVILIENTDGLTELADVSLWQNPRIDDYYARYAFQLSAQKAGKKVKLPAAPVSSKRLLRMMETMSEKYGVRWMFCAYEETGRVIERLLSNG